MNGVRIIDADGVYYAAGDFILHDGWFGIRFAVSGDSLEDCDTDLVWCTGNAAHAQKGNDSPDHCGPGSLRHCLPNKGLHPFYDFRPFSRSIAVI